MKKYSKQLALILGCLMISLYSCKKEEPKKPNLISIIQKQIDSIQQIYAPDKSVNVFDIKLEGDTNYLNIKGSTNIEDVYNTLKQIASNYDIADTLKLLPDTALHGKIYGVVSVSVIDIRTAPRFSAEMATQALMGMPVKVLQAEGDWIQVQTPDNYIGWTRAGSVQAMNKDEINKWNAYDKIVFTDDCGFSHYLPEERSPRISDLVGGNILRYEADAGQFFRVIYPDGRRGCIAKRQSVPMKDWVEANKKLSGQDIVDEAFKLKGVPYIWGGTSSKGVDCSGYAKNTLFKHGVIITRDASQQVNTGIPVDISKGYNNLQAGDLLFFRSKKDSTKIRHVAIYIGSQEFIHASTSGMVKTGSFNPKSSLYDKINTEDFVKASRIVGAVNTEGIWSIENNPFYQEQK